MESVWLELVLILVGVLANGFFAGAEIALVSARISRLAELRQQAVRGAAVAMRLKESPDAFLATIQIAITAVGTLASAVGGATAVDALTPWLAGMGAGRWAQPVALGLVIVAITYVSLILGELTPKAIALRNPERLAAIVAPIILRASRLSSGAVRVLTASTNGVLRLLGFGPARESTFVSEEEVRYLIREGAAKGIFEKVEEEFVHNVFEFADTTAREVMVPRPDVRALDVDTPPEAVLAAAVEIGHSRIPVYRGSIEHVVGILVMSDLLRAVARGERLELARLVRLPVFTPESSRLSVVLREFQRTRQELAVVVDEYGGVVGLLTVEDIVEEIVGEIRDERESLTPRIMRQADGSALVHGRATIAEVRETLGISIPPSPDYTTVAGFVISALGTIPGPGASVTQGGQRWTVVEMDGPRVVWVRVDRARGAPGGGVSAMV